MSSSIVIFVLGMPNQGVKWWKSKEIGRGWLGDIQEFFGVLPQSLLLELSWAELDLLTELGLILSIGSRASPYILRRAQCTSQFCSSL